MEFNALDVSQGGCRAIGQPRTDKEVFAVRNLNIPADIVRKGIVTKAEYDEYMRLTSETKTPEDLHAEAVMNTPATPDTDPVEPVIDIRMAYETKFGKPVPNNKKNDTAWIVSKLNS